MGEPLLIRHERAVVRNLHRHSAERARQEEELERGYQEATEAAKEEIETARARLSEQLAAEKARLEAEHADRRHRLEQRFKANHAAVEAEFASARATLQEKYDAASKKLKKDAEVAQWEVSAVHQASSNSVNEDFARLDDRLRALAERANTVHARASDLLDVCGVADEVAPPASDQSLDRLTDEQFVRIAELIDSAAAELDQLEGRLLFKIRPTYKLFLLSLVFFALVAGGLGWSLGWIRGVFFTTIGWGLLFPIVVFTVRLAARASARRCVAIVAQQLAHVRRLGMQAAELAKRTREEERSLIKQRRDRELKKTKSQFLRDKQQLDGQRERKQKQIEEMYPAQLDEIRAQYDVDREDCERSYPARLRESQERFERESAEAEQKYRAATAAAEQAYRSGWETLVGDWRQKTEQMYRTVAAIDRECQKLFPSLDEPSWDRWKPGDTIPPVVRFGQFDVRLRHVPNAVPTSERFAGISLADFSLPALAPIPVGSSLLLKSEGTSRQQIEQILQAVMLRLLTSAPPGKVRFTIVDPVGLGQSFAAFMHLADYDDALVTSRIWTEPEDIEEQLGKLVGHMEIVIQKYLRNEFQTLEDYNAHAGQLAEPLRVVVVAGFPHGFTDTSARRLLSIATSGARCGVFVLSSIDVSQPVPAGFRLDDIEERSVVLHCKDQKVVWKDQDFGSFPLSLDGLPPANLMTRILQTVGQMAQAAKRVEVPFDLIAPAPDRVWSQSSASGIDVPLGRTGATRTLNMKLGSGTAQHVLIAGKTGSGKSTLLHVLITNAALHYSPEELDLYLVDFKKGVEFKTYAAHQLPHARVIAVESEREFGLSVMQRLDAELRRRGEMFRAAEVQDLGAYRRVNGNKLPRILFIVDEFQEFFVEDDRIAQEANLLLDRLVRQGRAFGVHVILGSQTLGGAYSLARSTVGQMAVRIALQCSDADAHLILGEDNNAAGLLSRPGDAIYNDAGGLVEGNNPFQVVWLDDDKKDEHLTNLRELAQERTLLPAEPQIVFEGNAPADLERNHQLEQLLSAESWPHRPASASAWLGEAIAIKDPTAAEFASQSGSNVLCIGQQSEAALGLFASSLLSLAAQYASEDAANGSKTARFYVLDGGPTDGPAAAAFRQLSQAIPHALRIVSRRDLPIVLGELNESLQRRQLADEITEPDVFFFLYDLGRLRDLRRDEDDYGFSRSGSDEPPKPAKLFSSILSEGSAFGIHFMVWCDSLNNLNRTFERPLLREFEMRVLFQMSNADSSTLIDSPLASRLGHHRAIYFNEEQGRVEKFRPYRFPSDELLQRVRDSLGQRVPVRA